MVVRAALLIALATILFQGSVHADNALKLLGSHETTEHAVAESNAIFVGKVTKDGVRCDGCYNIWEVTITGLEVLALQDLRGSSSVLVTLSMAVPHDEVIPKVGDTYIFFNKSLTAIKLLPATDANIAGVKKLIAQFATK